jgi:hypothetical protein
MDDTAFGEGDLPHLGLAHHYLNRYRCCSDYVDLLSRTDPSGWCSSLVGQKASMLSTLLRQWTRPTGEKL